MAEASAGGANELTLAASRTGVAGGGSSTATSGQSKSRFHPKASKSWADKQNSSLRGRGGGFGDDAGGDDTAQATLLLCASLETDFEVFEAFLRQCLETQILVEFLAYTLGFLDGWE
jgi:hypothetical protein